MSTIKVNSIKNAATTDGGIAIDNTGHVQIDGVQLPAGGQLTNRNLIINGAMQVSQRGTSFDQGASDQFTTDRFEARVGSSYNWDSTITQASDGPPGFPNSLKITPDSISTPTGGQNGVIQYSIEAQDLQPLAYGTSSAKSSTISFWVKSNKTGVYCLQALSSDLGKQYLKEFQISSSDVWEHKEIVIPGDTSASFVYDNTIGCSLVWHLGSGPDDHSSETTSWTTTRAGLFTTTSNQVNFFDNTSNEFYLTGVQLEVGEKATPFEHRSYGDELIMCSRYYQKTSNESTAHGRTFAIGAFSANRGFGGFPLLTTMRVEPAISFDNLSWEEYSLASSHEISSISAYGQMLGPMISLDCRTATNVLTSNQVYMIRFDGGSTAADRGYIAFDSEL